MLMDFPKNSWTVRGGLNYGTTDTGDRYVNFTIDPDEDYQKAREGEIFGFIVPAEVDRQTLDQLLGEISRLGVRLVMAKREEP